MELTLSTPAMLFPAISLLLLAYTNRFIVLANLIRDLHSKYTLEPTDILSGQITNLQKRVNIIKNMQVFGVSSFFLCVLSMFLIFAQKHFFADILFGTSLIFLLISLALSLTEILISIKALSLQISDFKIENINRKK